LGKAEYKVAGGKLIRIQLVKKEGRIEKLKITGDFFLHPEELIEDLEKALVDQTLSMPDLDEFIGAFIERRGATLLGASPEDFAKCITMAAEKE
jgi:lipoate-protein ligase A